MSLLHVETFNNSSKLTLDDFNSLLINVFLFSPFIIKGGRWPNSSELFKRVQGRVSVFLRSALGMDNNRMHLRKVQVKIVSLLLVNSFNNSSNVTSYASIWLIIKPFF